MTNVCMRCGKKLDGVEFHGLPQCVDYLIGKVLACDELQKNVNLFIKYLHNGDNKKAHLQMLVLETLLDEMKRKE
jgi:hypothetical protein